MKKNQKIIFKSISFCKPIKGFCKSHAIWLNEVDGKNKMAPLAYFKKPRWLTDEQYKKLVEDLIDAINTNRTRIEPN